MPFMYCDPQSVIVHIRPATGPSHAQSGRITLASGAEFEISTPYGGPSPEGDPFLIKLRKTDHVQICYGPQQTWADEGPNARMSIIGDVESGAYFYGVASPGRAK